MIHTFAQPMHKSVFERCPTKVTKVHDAPEWIHKIKHDGYNPIVQRHGKCERLLFAKFSAAGAGSEIRTSAHRQLAA